MWSKSTIHAVKVGPISRATKKLYAKKLAKKMLENSDQSEESKVENSKDEEKQITAPQKVKKRG